MLEGEAADCPAGQRTQRTAAPIAAASPDKGSWLGSLKGQFWIVPDAFEPDEELIREMNEGEIFPPDERDRQDKAKNMNHEVREEHEDKHED